MEEDIEITKAIRYLEWTQSQMRLGNLPPYNKDVYKSIDVLLARLEQDERVIEEMAEYIVDLIKYINSEETREIKEIIDHFRKKCE